MKWVRDYFGDEDFCFTYGDGLADVNLTEFVKFHRAERRLATVTVTQPPGRFGSVTLDASRVEHFLEKPQGDGAWINAGFFVLSPKVVDYIAGDDTTWERTPLERLASEGQLSAWRHRGFFQPMDALRDKNLLEELWASGRAPWKTWA